MTISHARSAEPPTFDDLETTETDLRLANVDLLPDDDEEDAALAFMEAKTEPARPIFAEQMRSEPMSYQDDPRRGASARDEALLAFLETVRRVFGGNG
ncbi:MAG TPA: hypothetical protein VFV94_04890 [Polyangiaceae bacterium]|jgi:hypothetical protein|nr:hypothetical protein [Polyangiaceae bacterium]